MHKLICHSVCFYFMVPACKPNFAEAAQTVQEVEQVCCIVGLFSSEDYGPRNTVRKSRSVILRHKTKQKKIEKTRMLLRQIDGPTKPVSQFPRNICLNNTIGKAALDGYCNFCFRTKKEWSVWTISLLSSDTVRLPCYSAVAYRR
jgi:hypothetical protein